MHLVIVNTVTTLKKTPKHQCALILNLINEQRNNDLSKVMNFNEKNDCSIVLDSELYG